jgi:hypothetical protein
MGLNDELWVLRVARKWLDKGYNRTLWSHHKIGKLMGAALRGLRIGLNRGMGKGQNRS